MKCYSYSDRVIIEFDDRTRVGYNRKKYGDTLPNVVNQTLSEKRKIRNYYTIDEEGVTKIYFWDAIKKEIKFFIVDAKNFEKIRDYYWRHVSPSDKHILTRTHGTKIWLTHLLFNEYDWKENYKNGIIVDHIDGNPYNNLEENLRIVSSQRNQWNQDGTNEGHGIHLRNNKWRVTGSRALKQPELLVEDYGQALKMRKEYVDKIEEYLKNKDEEALLLTKKFND